MMGKFIYENYHLINLKTMKVDNTNTRGACQKQETCLCTYRYKTRNDDKTTIPFL